MADITLRPYQEKFIADVRRAFTKFRRVVGVAPCGAGKTVMTAWMIRGALEKGKRSIFFVHRNELVEQTADTFNALNIPHGVIASGVKSDINLPVQIASVQTLANRLNLFSDITAPNFLICDECHHILAETYKKILNRFPSAYLLGVTATPQRLGGINLGDVFGAMVQSLSVNQLIHLGNLTKFQYFAPVKSVDLSGVRDHFGEYNQHDLAHVMHDAAITGSIVDEYSCYACGKSAICYCVDVEHSQSVAQAFNSAGICAAHVDANTPANERKTIIEQFRAGNIQVLCNVELFGEGFDVPHCQAVILARPTQSLTLYIQQALRPLRPDPDDPDKVAVIIDHVQNYLRHGLPNKNHLWSLDPKELNRPCPNCGAYVEPIKKHGKKICPKCNFVFPTQDNGGYKPRRKDTSDGNIIEMDVSFDATENISPDLITAPRTIEEFIAVAKHKNYKLAWAGYRALEFAQSYNDCLHIADSLHYKKGWAWHQWQAKKNSPEV